MSSLDIQEIATSDPSSNKQVTYQLTGRLDTLTAPGLQEKLIPALETHPIVRLDFTNLTYLSSAGLRVLLIGEKTAKARGNRLELLNVSDAVLDVLRMTGFDQILLIS